jgi:YVTN family beta-propeller protein
VPERDQDSVAKFDLRSGALVKRVQFPSGSKPFMLRVSPNGQEVWVQATAANTNTILDAATLAVKASAVDGLSPVTNAWSPDGQYVLVTHEGDVTVSVYSARSGSVVSRLDLGGDGANIGFTPDSRTAFVAVTSANSMAVIDLQALSVTAHVPTGQWPSGLIYFPPPLVQSGV